MIILRQKEFAQRKYGQVVNRTENTYNHYTTPQNIIGIAKEGLSSEKTRIGKISVYQGDKDKLIGQNFNNLNNTALRKKKLTRGGSYSVKDLSNLLKTESPLNYAEQHLKEHGINSYLFYPSYKGKQATAPNPTTAYSNIDGLYNTKGIDKDMFYGGQTVALRKTRNPVRVVVNADNNIVNKGTDAGELTLRGKINNVKFEIPKSGVGTRDTDIKHVRRYLKGHKGLVNPTRETMEALYGSKYPHLDKFKSETEI